MKNTIALAVVVSLAFAVSACGPSKDKVCGDCETDSGTSLCEDGYDACKDSSDCKLGDYKDASEGCPYDVAGGFDDFDF